MTHHLGAPVLRHKSFKPGYSCIKDIRNYFSSLPKPVQDHELLIVGDRIFTDIVLANRMRSSSQVQPVPSLDGEKLGDEYPSAAEHGPLAVLSEAFWQKRTIFL